MAAPTLLLDALLAIAMAGLFGYVGAIMWRRHVADADGQRAMRRFATFWFGLALATTISAIRLLLGYLGHLEVGTHVALSAVAAVPTVALLWGLVSYLAYIYVGRRWALTAATILHLAILAFVGYLLLTRIPVGVHTEPWNVVVDYETELSPTLVGVTLAAILLPTLAAAVAYGTLFFQTDDRDVRYRIAMTSGAFLQWFGAIGLAAALSLTTHDVWPLVSRLLGLVATLMVLAAYRPPGWLRERLGLSPPVGEPRSPRRPEARLGPVVADRFTIATKPLYKHTRNEGRIPCEPSLSPG